MSYHIEQSRKKAAALGGFAGDTSTSDLWRLSKRELVEVAIRLGALTIGCADDADAGAERVREEVAALRAGGIL